MKNILVSILFILLLSAFTKKRKGFYSSSTITIDSLIILRLPFMMQVDPYLTCNDFRELFDEIKGDKIIVKDNIEISDILMFHKQSKIKSQKYMNTIDVRAKILLYSKFGNIDTICFGHNFKQMYIFNGNVFRFSSQKIFDSIENIIWNPASPSVY